MTRSRRQRGTRLFTWASSLVAVCTALAGCSQQTDVSVTAGVKSQYSHVWLTVQEVWFNTSATATPEETTWNRFPLATPITVDLARLSAGTLGQVASQLKVPAGTYRQIRLVPVDPSAALASSASAANAKFNAEADFTDSSGTEHRLPLELLNPPKGIGVATTLTLKASTSQVSGAAAVTGGTTSTASNSTNTATTTGTNTATTTGANTDMTTGTNTGTTTTTDPMTGMLTTTSNDTLVTATATTSATPASIAISLDGVHDLVQFAYGTATGVLLNPHAAALDVSAAGAVRGQIDTTNIASSVASSGQIDVEVTAEQLSSDGSRHVAVKSVQVASDSSFVLYPLATSSNSATRYDLVIHGPQIATVIVKSVPVAVGDPTTAAALSLATVAPRSTSAFSFNIAPGTAALPAGALVDLYQTLPGSGEVPYLIEQTALEPFSRALFADQSLSAGTIDFGTYVSGASVSLTPATPAQGAATYVVSAQAPLFSDAALTTAVAAPASGTGPVLIAMPILSPAAGATASTLSMTVAATTPGKYDHGELIVSHGGGIVQTVTIDSALAQNGGSALLIPGLPGGGTASSVSDAVYYLSTRAWNSKDPAGTLQRQSYATPVDLRSGSVSGLSVNVD